MSRLLPFPVALTLLCVAAVGTTPVDARAQTAASSAAADDQLARIADALESVEDLLAQQLETQTLDLLLKRTQLVSTEVTQLDRQLRQAEASRDDLEDELLRIETQLDAFESAGVDIPEEELVAMTIQMEVEQERLVRRLREIESEIAGLDTRLARKQAEMDDWRDILDRRLGGV